MIFDSLDIIAIESNIEIADYSMESAKFEIDCGNSDVFTSVYEAATNTSEKENINWVSSVISKIKMFAKSAIAKLKMVLNQLATKFRKVKAVRIQKKMSSGKFDNKELKSEGTESVGAALTILQNYGSALSSKVSNCCAKFSDNVKSKNVPKSKDEFIKSYLGINVNQKANTSDVLPFNTAKSYIDNAVQYLTQLSASTKDLGSVIKGLKENGLSSSEIRYGISTMYNYLTAVVRDYYFSAMSVAKYFMKNSSGVQKTENDTSSNATSNAGSSNNSNVEKPKETITPEEVKETIDEAESIFKDLANKLDINDSEISKITRQYKVEVEKAGNEWKNIASSGNRLKQLPESTGYNWNVDAQLTKQLNAYAKRMHEIIKRRLANAETEESYKDAKALFAEAEKVWRELVHKKFDGKLSRKQIKDLENSFNGADLRTAARFMTVDEIAEKGPDTINLSKFDDTTDIARFVNYAKTLPRSTRDKVKERAITKCNKIIRNFRKKYGSDPDIDNMTYMDRNRYEEVLELRKQLKSL